MGTINTTWTASSDNSLRSTNPSGDYVAGDYDPTSSMGAGGTGTEYFVSPTGSTGNTGLTEGSPWPFQHALDNVAAGEIITLLPGTYDDTHPTQGGQSPYGVAYAIQNDGTLAEPITIRSRDAIASGTAAEIDGNGVNNCLHFLDHKYYRVSDLRFYNGGQRGISNWDQIPDFVPDENSMSAFVVIEDCDFYDITGTQGDNVCAIAPTGVRQWVMRGCVIDGIHTTAGTNAGNGVQSYGLFDCLFENNTIINISDAFYLKDHYIQTNPPTTTAHYYPLEAEIRLNYLEGSLNSFQMGVRASNSCPAGYTYVHNNIINGGSNAAVFENMAAAAHDSTGLRLENNIIIKTSGNTILTQRMGAVTGTGIEIYGNIMVGTTNKIGAIRYASGNGKITEIDYNIYDSPMTITTDKFHANETDFTSLAAWQAATSGDADTLGISSPDTNSIISTTSNLFEDYAGGDYTYAVGSDALNFMPDNSHAGAYQTGSETIGAGRTI